MRMIRTKSGAEKRAEEKAKWERKVAKHPRKCGECHHFNFDWNNHWCALGEKPTITTQDYPDYWFPICMKYSKGWSHNHEY